MGMAAVRKPSRSARLGGSAATGSDSGAHAYSGAGREQLADLQRARIVSATFDVVAQRGAGGVTVAHVVECSGVSRRTFYESFSDREDCLLAAFERALKLASDRVISAFESERDWRERIRAGLVAFLVFCDEQPSVARMLVCESQASGLRVAAHRSEILACLTRIVAQGRAEGKADRAEGVSPLAAEGIIGGVLAVVQARLTERVHGRPLVSLANELMSLIVLPYLGVAAARRELQRAVPASGSEAVEGSRFGDPFKAAGIRLTYRTVRVLMAIFEHPGASNRLIADSVEITDQGQISKLLSRLERAGMLANSGLGSGKGAPNVWTLTSSGRQVVDSVRMHTEGSQSHGPPGVFED